MITKKFIFFLFMSSIFLNLLSFTESSKKKRKIDENISVTLSKTEVTALDLDFEVKLSRHYQWNPNEIKVILDVEDDGEVNDIDAKNSYSGTKLHIYKKENTFSKNADYSILINVGSSTYKCDKTIKIVAKSSFETGITPSNKENWI